ncbi:MAG: FKBP-type peptidyl-prolyl cis-trans isomerase [Lachnospiraceae bacterium]|nr:FKBP-type peptidyl-prolyl cis-trans isomerase [Lachnospiraceae bacterium]
MSEMSKSKQKRLEQEQARNAQHRSKAIRTFWAVLIPLLIVGGIVAAIVVMQMNKLDYSRYLADNGTIKGVKATELATVNTDAMSFSRSELTPSDDEIESEIQKELDSKKEISADASLESEYGDDVSITYSSAIDGADFLSQAEPAKYSIGSDQIAADFDDALVGHKAGDDFTADVTFPADYSDEKAAGKTVSFNIHMDGVYVAPAFDDAYVAANHSDAATTADAYRQYLKDDHYKTNLRKEVEKSVSLNSTISSVPTAYSENLVKVLQSTDRSSLVQMYQMFGMEAPTDPTWKLMGMDSEEAYLSDVKARAQIQAQEDVEIQSLSESFGLSASSEDAKSYFCGPEKGYTAESFDALVKENGMGYYAQQYLKKIVLDKLCETVKVTD